MHQIDHTKNIIELHEVCFSYTKEEVIKDVSLAIHKGDYVGIIGPNGGGKSTLLQVMLGLLTPQKGEVKLFGQDIKKFNDWHKIGYLSQRKVVEMNLPVTVEEIVEMGRYGRLGLFHMPGKKDHEKVIQALRQVDMLAYKDRQIGDLSGGQQQRVFIAKALVSDPEVIFLDEPTVGVDIKTQKEFYSFLRTLNKELDLTLILVSHELDVVAHEATEIGYINRTMEYYGEPDEFLKGEYFHQLIGRGGLHH